tara:strand:+ start:564 stop:1421 length:858 start_codon:yes stop_codon:yes gene_type:complete
MTGYGNYESQNSKISFSVELKSINSKYFESNIKLPYLFSNQEQKISDILRDKLIRGRVSFNLNYKMKDSGNMVYGLDYAKLNSYKLLLDNINIKVEDKVELKDILSFQDIILLERENIDSDIIDLLYQTLDNVIIEHNDFRKKEGSFIEEDIQQYLSRINSSIKNIESVWENKRNEYFDKYNEKIKSISDKYALNNDRLFQEVAIILDKRDINEEIVRIKSHLDSFIQSIEKYDNLGKRLIFLIQELFREINTIASKSEFIEINESVIDIKTDLEKIKEQVQNIL